jgi:hypothetical protein
MHVLAAHGSHWFASDATEERWFQRCAWYLMRIPFRLWVADLIRTVAPEVRRLETSNDACRVADRTLDLSKSNRLFKSIEPLNYASFWRRFAQAELDRELTRKIVERKRGGRIDGGVAVCRESMWVTCDESIELTNEPLREGTPQSWKLPTRYDFGK